MSFKGFPSQTIPRFYDFMASSPSHSHRSSSAAPYPGSAELPCACGIHIQGAHAVGTQQGQRWVRGQPGKAQPCQVWKEALYPLGMRQSNGVKPEGLEQREWGAGWGLSPPQHRARWLPSARDDVADMFPTSKPEGVSGGKMGWGRQIPGLGISLPPGKGGLGSSQSHLHRGE